MSTITIGLLAIVLMIIVMSIMTIQGMQRNDPIWVFAGGGLALVISGTGNWWVENLRLPTKAHGLSWLVEPIRALPDVVWIGEAIMGLALLAVALVLTLLKIFRQGE